MNRELTTNVILTALIAGYVLFIVLRSGPYAGGSDSSGYLNHARLLARGSTTTSIRPISGVSMHKYSPWAFTPLGFTPSKGNERADTLVPSYPAGLPLHLLLASWFVGWDQAPVLVNALVAAGGLLALYLVGLQLGLSCAWRLYVTAVVALFPVAARFFLEPMSDSIAMSWCIATVLLCLSARRRAWMAACAGFAFGMAVLVRPSDVLLLPAIGLALAANCRRGLLFALGGFPCAAFGLFHNLSSSGSLLLSPYGSTHLSTLDWTHLIPTANHFAHWLLLFLGPLVIGLWMVSSASATVGKRRHLLLAAWAWPFLAFYACYPQSRETWWYLRFILPAVPAAVLGAGVVGQGLWSRTVGRWPLPKPMALVLAVLMIGGLSWGPIASSHYFKRFNLPALARQDMSYPRSVVWMKRLVPAGTPVVCMQVSGAIYYYSDYPIVRYDTVSVADFAGMVAEARVNGVELHALLYEFEVDDFKRKLFGKWGSWREIGRLGRASLWRLEYPGESALRQGPATGPFRRDSRLSRRPVKTGPLWLAEMQF